MEVAIRTLSPISKHVAIGVPVSFESTLEDRASPDPVYDDRLYGGLLETTCSGREPTAGWRTACRCGADSVRFRLEL